MGEGDRARVEALEEAQVRTAAAWLDAERVVETAIAAADEAKKAHLEAYEAYTSAKYPFHRRRATTLGEELQP